MKLSAAERKQIAEQLAQAIKDVRAQDTALNTAAKQVLDFYKTSFLSSQSSYRNSNNSRYYNSRFKSNNLLAKSGEYLSLQSSHSNINYIQNLHILQGYIEKFLVLFLNKQQTQYSIYYTDKEGNTYRKVFTSEEEAVLYSSTKPQALYLTSETRELIRNEIKDVEQQAIFSEHYAKYEAQLEATYNRLNKRKTYAKIFARQQFNAGIKTEAFERHLQNLHRGDPTTITPGDNDFDPQNLKTELLESFGFTPWWTKGDVSNLQVKHFSDGQTLSGGSVRSLEELLNFINMLYNQEIYATIPPEKIAHTVTTGLLDAGFNTVLQKTIEKELNKLTIV